jgi:hypothetical protein
MARRGKQTMRFEFFAVPVVGGEAIAKELNSFFGLASGRPGGTGVGARWAAEFVGGVCILDDDR